MAHQPVLLNEVLDLLHPKPGDLIVDGTVDGGGHANEIIKRIAPEGILLGLDWDKKLLEQCEKYLYHEHSSMADSGHIVLRHNNYADLPRVLEEEKFGKADGLLIDLGFSSEQLEASGRGFSFSEKSKDEPLLMTYDDSMRPVAQILREENEESLANIIYEFGGERMSRKIAKAIKDAGRKKTIMASGELADIIREALPGSYERGRIDPATRTFQALRIYANGELENLKTILAALPEVMKSNGRVAIISFHSIEDGMVKRAFQSLAKENKASLLTKKPVEASREEVMQNPRSRSAKVRGIQFI